MKKTLKAVVAVMAILSVGTPAACKSHHSGHDPKKLKEHVEASLKMVGATDEQRLKIGAVTDNIIADGSDLCKNSKGLGKKFASCLLLDKPNKEWLHQTVDEKAKEMTKTALPGLSWGLMTIFPSPSTRGNFWHGSMLCSDVASFQA